MKEECKLESADIDRIFIQADKFECVRIQAEATEYRLNEADLYEYATNFKVF